MALTASEQKELDALELEQLEHEYAQAQENAPVNGSESNTAEAALQGLGQGASFGYIPEMQAGTAPAINYALEIAAKNKALANMMGVPQGAEVDYGTFQDRLKSAQAADKKLAEENPLSYAAGNISGAMLVPLPGAGKVKAASKLARIGLAAAKGAGIGGLTGAVQNVPEETPSMTEDFKANLKQRLEQAETGAIFGGAFSGIAQGATELIEPAAQKLKSYFAAKQMGLTGQTKRAEKLIKDGKLEKLADFMDENGMMDIGQTPEDVMVKSRKIMNESGKDINKIYNEASSKIPAEGLNLENATPEQIRALTGKASLNTEEISNDILREAKDLFDTGRMDKATFRAIKEEATILSKRQSNIEDIFDYRKNLDDRLNKIYQKPLADLSAKEEALLNMRFKIKDRIDAHLSAIDGLANTSEVNKLQKLNKAYSQASDIHQVAEKYNIKGQTKNLFGLPEMIAGSAIGGGSLAFGDDPVGAGMKALGTAALYGAGRKYGPGISYAATKVASKAAKAAAKSPYMATKAATIPWINMDNKNKGE